MDSRRSPKNHEAKEARLREQVRLLTLENQTLRAFIAEQGYTGAPTPKSTNANEGAHERRMRRGSVTAPTPKSNSSNMPTDPVTPKAGGRGCSCKGNCATRVCGCVKRNVPCAEFCRCGDDVCQNSEPDKENIGDPNHQPQLTKEAADSLAKLSKLTLTENKGTKAQTIKHIVLEPLNKRVEEVVKARSLFSPDVAEAVFKFEPTSDLEFEDALHFGDDQDTKVAETAAKTGESSGDKAAVGKKSKKDEKKEKHVAGSSALSSRGNNKKARSPRAPDDENNVNRAEEAAEEAVAEETAGKKNSKNMEKNKWKVAIGRNKRQASKARIRDNSSESETEDKMESDKSEEEVAREPVKEKTKGKMNNTKKEPTKKQPVRAPTKSKKRQLSKARIRNNSTDSEAEDNIDSEEDDEETVKESVKEKSKERKNITKKEAKQEKSKAAPVQGAKRTAHRARISSDSESIAEDKTDTEERKATKTETASTKNGKKVVAKKGAQNNRIESSESSDDGDLVEPAPRQKNKDKEETEGKPTTSSKARSNRASNEDSEDSEIYDDCDPQQNNNNVTTAEATNERMETHEDNGDSEQSELSPASSKRSNNVSGVTDNSLSPEADANFNPMKPRRQLSRSPVPPRNESYTKRILDHSEKVLPAPLQEEPEEEQPEPAELKEAIIENWDEHKANLVKCTKCGRKLYPHRIKKHEMHCQKI